MTLSPVFSIRKCQWVLAISLLSLSPCSKTRPYNMSPAKKFDHLALIFWEGSECGEQNTLPLKFYRLIKNARYKIFQGGSTDLFSSLDRFAFICFFAKQDLQWNCVWSKTKFSSLIANNFGQLIFTYYYQGHYLPRNFSHTSLELRWLGPNNQLVDLLSWLVGLRQVPWPAGAKEPWQFFKDPSKVITVYQQMVLRSHPFNFCNKDPIRTLSICISVASSILNQWVWKSCLWLMV